MSGKSVVADRVRFVWLASYPKSGSTWFRAILWALDHPGIRDIDVNDLGAVPWTAERAVFDELAGVDSGLLPPVEIESLLSAVHERLLDQTAGSSVVGGAWVRKTHDAYTRTADGRPIFPPAATAGAVYLVRNPLDVCVSYAHHQGHGAIDAVIAQMADPQDAMAAERDRQIAALPQRLGGWSWHVRSWLDQADVPVTVVRYEDLHSERSAVVAEAAHRCGRRAGRAEILAALERCRFARLARREAETGFRERPPGTGSFFRRGVPGGWRDRLSVAQVNRVVADHGAVMARLGYLDGQDEPI